MVRLHKHAKNQMKPMLKRLKEMSTRMHNGSKTALMYCDQCWMPSIEEKVVPLVAPDGKEPKEGDAKELTVKWCVFCEEPVTPKVLFKKDYIALIKRLDMIYRGLRKNV
jgi:hypothetical protein